MALALKKAAKKVTTGVLHGKGNPTNIPKPMKFAAKRKKENGLANAPLFSAIIKDRVSLYLKVAMLLRSSIHSGKPSEIKKMRSYLKGLLQPNSADKSGKDLQLIANLFDAAMEENDPHLILNALEATDLALEKIRRKL